MLDVENVKNVLQAEVYKREKAKAKFYKYRSSGNKSQEDFYKRRYNLYCNRFDGMCHMLYELGYLAWANDDNSKVFVEKRVDGEIFSLADELPF